VRPWDAAVDGPHAGLHLRHHARRQARQHRRESAGIDLADHLAARRPVGVKAFDVGEHDQLLGVEPHREGGGGSVGVTL